MYKIVDKLFRFAAAVGTILLGTQTLFICAKETTPFMVVIGFVITVWSFGMAYWWMFYAKQDYS